MKVPGRNIAIWIVILSSYFVTSCKSGSKDPQVQAAHKSLSDVLSFIPGRSLNKDSILVKAENFDSEEINALISNLESRFGEIIAKSRATQEREAKIRAQFDLKEGFHIKTKYSVQQSMDDPDSFVHKGTTHVDKGDTIHVAMKFDMRDPNGVIQSYLIESKVDIEGNVLVGDISRLSN